MIYWYLFFLIPVITALFHLAKVKRPLKGGSVERVFALHIVFWGIGVAGIFGFLVNSCGFLEDWIARDLGWSEGSPFQVVLGMGLLAIGVVGLLAPFFQGLFLLAAIFIGVVYAIGEGFVIILSSVPTQYMIYTIIYDWGGAAVLLAFTTIYLLKAGFKNAAKGCVPGCVARCFPQR